ncbi:hypothetical protein C8R14_12135 [Nitrosomonas eutropha]|uniref:Uncharacterized protein n=1 Tax=Nitrosomonas eutropha TaxID=916 RepID=A0ABX5M7Y6_9PROT|nr:hypothetical protein C8R14_12135 [Nitrosomonas eutropha]
MLSTKTVIVFSAYHFDYGSMIGLYYRNDLMCRCGIYPDIR